MTSNDDTSAPDPPAIVPGRVWQRLATYLADPADDDDDPVDAATLTAETARMQIGARGPRGERLDTPEIIAAAEVLHGAGATSFELGWEEGGWWASVQILGRACVVREHPGPGAAARGMVYRLLPGAKCSYCGGVVTLDPIGVPQPRDTVIADGTLWTEQDQQTAGPCRWYRVGSRWTPGCEPGR